MVTVPGESFTLNPKLAVVTLSVHYKSLNNDYSKKCERLVEFLLFSYKRLCTMAFGYHH